MIQPEQSRDPIADVLRKATELDGPAAEMARADFLERVDREASPGKGSRLVYVLAPLAAAAIALLALFAWPESALDYNVAGASEDGGYIHVAGEKAAEVKFSDATRLVAAPGARLRVVETHADGARVSLEQGQLGVAVTHTGSSAWNFVAGPFTVHVTGTRFDLRWDPKAEQLRVDLHEGSVEIAGYDASGPMPLQAGQTFVGDARARTMQVSSQPRPREEAVGSGIESSSAKEGDAAPTDTTQETDPSTSPEVADVAPEMKPLPGKEARAPKKPEASGARTSWSSLVSKGQFRDVVAAAQKRGVASCLSTCSASDLGALADAARYTGQNDLAKKSLVTLRKRFSSSSGVRAAFLLGRLHESQGSNQEAKRWYETSLRESPGGSFAGGSLAGKMRTVLALQGRNAAKPIARDYLRRYPGGVHASAARKIAEP